MQSTCNGSATAPPSTHATPSVERDGVRSPTGLRAMLHGAARSVAHGLYLTYSLMVLLWEVVAGVLGVPSTAPGYAALQAQLNRSTTYAEWWKAARTLDELDGYDDWRTLEASDYFNFDGVISSMRLLLTLRQSGDTPGLMTALSSCVHRSLYGMNNTMLYHYRTGTKSVIHSYTSLVCCLLIELGGGTVKQHLLEDASAGGGAGRAEEANGGAAAGASCSQDVASPLAAVSAATASLLPHRPHAAAGALVASPEDRYAALWQMRAVYGTTALVLNGGMIVGPLHLGVARALYGAGLLPRVIYGYRAGALVAALVGCIPNVASINAANLNFHSFSGKDGSSTMLRRLRRLRSDGSLMDASVLTAFLRDNIGEVTFLEAYQRTGRVLNIQYTAFYRNEERGRTQRCSCLLNYLTAPDVLVHTAAVNSLASVPFMFQRVPLLARGLDGKICTYDPTVLTRGFAQRLSDSTGNGRRVNSLHRLRELFHVQFFIVSECSSVLKPSVLRSGRTTFFTRFVAVLHIVVSEVLRLVWLLLCATPLEPYLVTVMDNDLAHWAVAGDMMMVVPEVGWRDVWRLWRSGRVDVLSRYVLRSERQVWPRLEEVRMGVAIEQAITAAMRALAERHNFRSHARTPPP